MEALFGPLAPPLCRECRSRLSPRNGCRDAHRHCREKRRRGLEVDWRREVEEELHFLEDDAMEVALADASLYDLEEGEDRKNYDDYLEAQMTPIDVDPYDWDECSGGVDERWEYTRYEPTEPVRTAPVRASRWQSSS